MLMKQIGNKDPGMPGMDRRSALAGIGAGLAVGTFHGAPCLAEEAQADIQRLLYVTNDNEQRVDVFDIKNAHRLIRSFPIVGKKAGGICADPSAGRLFITQQSKHTVTAYDLTTGAELWSVKTSEVYKLRHPDRLSITKDGSALYVPMKDSHVTLVLNAADGKRIAQFERPGRPHNSWCGEQGKFMYVAGRSHHTMYLADQRSHQVAKKIGPFDWPIRPFSVDRDERFIYLNLTYLHGFAVADIATGEIQTVNHLPPYERRKHWMTANAGLPHGDHPFSHGIAVRPHAQEVWHLDDQWGYLNVFDTSKSPFKPEFKRTVELFNSIDEPWGKEHGNRWVAFSLDGKCCYPSDGMVIDAETGSRTELRITPSEKLIEVEFHGGVAKRVSGQMGGVYEAHI